MVVFLNLSYSINKDQNNNEFTMLEVLSVLFGKRLYEMTSDHLTS